MRSPLPQRTWFLSLWVPVRDERVIDAVMQARTPTLPKFSCYFYLREDRIILSLITRLSRQFILLLMQMLLDRDFI